MKYLSITLLSFLLITGCATGQPVLENTNQNTTSVQPTNGNINQKKLTSREKSDLSDSLEELNGLGKKLDTLAKSMASFSNDNTSLSE